VDGILSKNGGEIVTRELFNCWLNLAKTLPDNSSNICPICQQKTVEFQYVGDPKTRIGYLDIWCSECLKGVHISRVGIPPNVSFLPFDVSGEELSKRIPDFTQITPL
jgi:hypothetical protein